MSMFISIFSASHFFLRFIQYITKPYRFHQIPNNSTTTKKTA